MSGQTHSTDTVKGSHTRSVSVSAIHPSVHQSQPSPLRNISLERAASIPAGPQKSASPRDDTPNKGIPTLDLVGYLQRSESSVVKTRSGSVLTRGFILKTDHYPSGKSREAHAGSENTYPHQDVHWILISMYMELRTLELPASAVLMYLVRLNLGHKDFVRFYLFCAVGQILRTQHE